MSPAEFKARREAIELTQAQLGRVFGMGVGCERTIGRWERGERPMNPIAAFALKLLTTEWREISVKPTGETKP